MATLPKVQGRDVPRPSRPIANISPQAAMAPGNAMAQLGGAVNDLGDNIEDRENTAAAKERDAYVSDEIRKLMYDPESGFTNQYGKDAVSARNQALENLNRLKETALKDLSGGAKRKLESTLTRRIEAAQQRIDTHTSGERRTWLKGASDARITAARQDALLTEGDISQSFGVIATELRQQADLEGWDNDKLNLALDGARSELVSDQTLMMAQRDPEYALSFLNKNAGALQPSEVLNLRAKLEPEAKAFRGRRLGTEAFASLGDMSAIMDIADDSLGMGEVEQNATIRQYLSDGGIDLDPAKTAWCAAFVNATLAKAGLGGTGSLMARSFLDWGTGVSEPKKGDVVVLRRGNPPFGHVGFFDGFDENGGIRLLGGNQSDSVNVSTYKTQDVLGYRRAVKNPSQADAGAVMLQMMNDISDPAERKAAMDEFSTRLEITQGQRKANLAAATDEAFQFIEAGGAPDQMPLDVRRTLGQDAMSSLRTYHGKIAGGSAVETDPETYAMLRQMQASDPSAFKELNLVSYVGRLSSSDFKGFVDQQNEGGSDTVAASTLMTTAKRQMEAAGIDTSPKDGSDDAKLVAGMQTRLLKWQDEFVVQQNRKPTPAEIDKQIGLEMLPVIIDPKGMFNKLQGKVFEEQNVPIEYLAEAGVNVGGVDVPAAVVAEQIEELTKGGATITTDILIDRLSQLLTDAGAL